MLDIGWYTTNGVSGGDEPLGSISKLRFVLKNVIERNGGTAARWAARRRLRWGGDSCRGGVLTVKHGHRARAASKIYNWPVWNYCGRIGPIHLGKVTTSAKWSLQSAQPVPRYTMMWPAGASGFRYYHENVIGN